MSLCRRLLPALLAVTACDAGNEEPRDVGELERLAVTDTEATAILEFLNDPTTDLPLLDDDVGLDVRAASGLIETRDGVDGQFGTADDELFHDLEAVDAVPWVGASAIGKLRDFVAANPPPAGELVEGVHFNGAEAEAVVWGVSHASLSELDDTVGLASHAAASLVQGGPFDSMVEIGAVKWVGPAALEDLRDYAPVWIEELAASDLAGTYDGIAFDAPSAVTALEIANEASYDQMLMAGMYLAGITRIIDGRPYDDLQSVADTNGVGPVTMQGLYYFSVSGNWEGPEGEPTPEPCDASLTEISHPAVDGYSDNMVDFDPWAEQTPYHLAAFDVPSCLDVHSEDGQQALRDAMVEVAGWQQSIAEFPELFEDHPLVDGTARFSSLLDSSIDYLADVRDDLLADGNFGADAFFDALAGLYAQVDEIGADDSVSMGLHLEAVECSEDAAIVVDADAGIAVVIHRRPGC